MKPNLKISRLVPRRDGGQGRFPVKFPDLSWQSIADAMDTSPEWICRIMNGRARPSMRLAIRLSAYLGITLEQLNGLYRRRRK